MKDVNWKTLLTLYLICVGIVFVATSIDSPSIPPAEVCLEGTIPQVIGGVVHIKAVDGIVRGVLVGGFSNGVVYCVPSDVFMRDLEPVKLLYSLDSYQFEEPKPPQVAGMKTTHSFEPLEGF